MDSLQREIPVELVGDSFDGRSYGQPGSWKFSGGKCHLTYLIKKDDSMA